jgi:poly [ADP-ribose] polymerase
MLNQTDIGFGVRGHNKFYAMQLIENDEKNRFFVFRKWGRVGAKTPQSQFDEHVGPKQAVAQFRKYFEKKTGGNKFGEDFSPVAGKYSVGENPFHF